MYRELPRELQQRVRAYLEGGDFCKAKDIHDAWVVKMKLTQPSGYHRKLRRVPRSS